MSASEAFKEAALITQLEFINEVRGLKHEPDPPTLLTLVQKCFAKFVGEDAPRNLGGCIPDEIVAGLSAELAPWHSRS